VVGQRLQVLGVAQNATVAEVKKSFRQLVKQYHPDLNSSEKATIAIQSIYQAYQDFCTKYPNKF
jgi:DnaJ-class molecular chaperone